MDMQIKKQASTAAKLLMKVVSYADALIQCALHPSLVASLFIPSHLTCQERLALFRFARQGGTIAEIGSYIGASTCCFSAAFRSAGTGKIICIDTWQNDAMTEGKRDTWEAFLGNTRRYQDCIIPIRGYSTEVVQSVMEVAPRLDVLFIDGDHSYTGVKGDWEAYKGFLKSGGLVIFHDYGWAEGVKRVIHQDVIPLTNRQGSLPNMWWGWIGEVS